MNMDDNMLLAQIRELIETEPNYISVMANASALLMETMDDLNWAGFYLVRNGRLMVGPFQGKPACILIGRGKGVCGTAWAEDRTILVPDVHKFPGHIACDSASRSELVIPMHRGNDVAAVMDLDSPRKNRFSEEDRAGLEKVVRLMEEKVVWQ